MTMNASFVGVMSRVCIGWEFKKHVDIFDCTLTQACAGSFTVNGTASGQYYDGFAFGPNQPGGISGNPGFPNGLPGEGGPGLAANFSGGGGCGVGSANASFLGGLGDLSAFLRAFTKMFNPL